MRSELQQIAVDNGAAGSSDSDERVVETTSSGAALDIESESVLFAQANLAARGVS